jgi:hypothetical protein
MRLHLRHPGPDEEVNQTTGLRPEGDKNGPNHFKPSGRQPISRRLGVMLIELLPGFAACVGLFLFLASLAEHPPASRMAINVALLIPLTVLIVWSIIKRVWNQRD